MGEIANRRVVTGLDAEGRSAVILDGPVPHHEGMGAQIVWRTDGLPADNGGSGDTAAPFTIDMLHAGGSLFTICRFPPGMPEFMHATDTIDYLVILSGRVTLVLESGSVDLGPGDLVVDRGVAHAWRNGFDEVCTAVAINLPAKPVGKGRTV